VFPTGSPVALGQKKKPKLLSGRAADGRIRKLNGKLKSLLEARCEANKVYGDSYFENHYPLADKDMKTVLDKKVMTAHSRLRAKGAPEESEEESEREEPRGVTIILNIGG
jgi:hypothetical protein